MVGGGVIEFVGDERERERVGDGVAERHADEAAGVGAHACDGVGGDRGAG